MIVAQLLSKYLVGKKITFKLDGGRRFYPNIYDTYGGEIIKITDDSSYVGTLERLIIHIKEPSGKVATFNFRSLFDIQETTESENLVYTCEECEGSVSGEHVSWGNHHFHSTCYDNAYGQFGTKTNNPRKYPKRYM